MGGPNGHISRYFDPPLRKVGFSDFFHLKWLLKLAEFRKFRHFPNFPYLSGGIDFFAALYGLKWFFFAFFSSFFTFSLIFPIFRGVWRVFFLLFPIFRSFFLLFFSFFYFFCVSSHLQI